MKISKNMKIKEILEIAPEASRILVNNGLAPGHINKNILETLEKATTGFGMPQSVLENIIKDLEKIDKGQEKKAYAKPESILTVTPSAANEFKKVMAGKGKAGHAIRFGIVSSGCANYTYNIDFEKKPANEDLVLNIDGLKFFVAKKSLRLIEGSKIDYIEKDGGMFITNPHVKSR